jgi:hypothetical protein
MTKAASPPGGKNDNKSRVDPGLKDAFDYVVNAVKNDLRQSNTKSLKNYLIDQKRLPLESSSLGKIFQGRPSPSSVKILRHCAEYLHENATKLGVSDRSADDWLKAIYGPLSRDSSVSDEAPEVFGSLNMSPLAGAASENSMIAASSSERGASHSQASSSGDQAVLERPSFLPARSGRAAASHEDYVDLLVMVALEDERDAILHPTKGLLRQNQWSELESRHGETYHLGTLETDHEPIRVAVGLPAGLQGSLAMGNKTTSLISELHPRFAVLVGVCAGDGELARYGDVIVPNTVFNEVEGGKRTDDQFSPDGFHREGQHFDSADQFIKFAALWKPRFLARNPRPEDLDGFVYELVSCLQEYTNGIGAHPGQRESAFRIPDATIRQLLDKFGARGYLRQNAAGHHVLTKSGLNWFKSLGQRPSPPREFECLFDRHLVTVRDVEENDDVFRRLKIAHGRHVAAVEREAIGFLNAAKGKVDGYFVAKAVQDYARFPKTDHYRMFAAKASAAFAIEFVATRAHVSRWRIVPRPQQQIELPPQSPVPWLYRPEAFASSDKPDPARPLGPVWPVSWSATVGLDRSPQVTICSGVGGAALLADLKRVEAVLASKDTADRFARRAWSLATGFLEESDTEAVVKQIQPNELRRISKDVLVGVVQRHFERHGGSLGASIVLALPSEEVGSAGEVAEILERGSIQVDYGVGIDVLERPTGVWDGEGMRSLDASLFRIICDFDKAGTLDRSEELLNGTKTIRSQRLIGWLRGEISDDEYLSAVHVRDLRIAVLAGRFGKSGHRPTPNAIRRSLALVRAASVNPSLLFALGSLSTEPALVALLLDAPVVVRAVAGLVTPAESSAKPTPWFRSPVDSWRHRRALKSQLVPEEK